MEGEAIMQLLFFLKPKNLVAYLEEDNTLRQAMEKIEHYRYSAIPILNKAGQYVGTLSEGDILWFIKSRKHFSLKDAENIKISEIPVYHKNIALKVDATQEDLMELSKRQNFVPVIDDRNIFIGIITRQDIMDYVFKQVKVVK